MSRFYANENFPFPVSEELRRLGHDVLTVQETGKAEQSVSDADVLKFAIGEGRAILTINRKDFLRLHRESPEHAGIVICTEDPDFVGQAHRIDRMVKNESELLGKVFRVNRPA